MSQFSFRFIKMEAIINPCNHLMQTIFYTFYKVFSSWNKELLSISFTIQYMEDGSYLVETFLAPQFPFVILKNAIRLNAYYFFPIWFRAIISYLSMMILAAAFDLLLITDLAFQTVWWYQLNLCIILICFTIDKRGRV